MTRENKLALVIGFGLILFVGILVSDHFSAQRLDSAELTRAKLAESQPEPRLQPLTPPEELLAQNGEGVITLVQTPAPGQPQNPTITDPSGVQFPTMPEPLPISVATTDDPDGTPVRFYKVVQGDTLWKIAAREYGDGSLSRELAEYNKTALTNGIQLSLNQELRLPSLKKLRPTRMATSVAAASVGTKEPAAAAVADARTHTIAKGDTVYQLARKFNVKPQAIMAANGISDAASLKPGRTLKIPASNY